MIIGATKFLHLVLTAQKVSASRMIERGALPHTPRFYALVSRRQ
jgi:hypothetical protein